MNAQTMKTVRMLYSITATVICRRALGRRPTTAVAVSAVPMITIASAPTNWLLGEKPSSASDARADRDHVDQHEAGERDQHQPADEVADVRAERAADPFVGRAGVLAPHVQPLERDRDAEQADRRDRERQHRPVGGGHHQRREHDRNGLPGRGAGEREDRRAEQPDLVALQLRLGARSRARLVRSEARPAEVSIRVPPPSTRRAGGHKLNELLYHVQRHMVHRKSSKRACPACSLGYRSVLLSQSSDSE